MYSNADRNEQDEEVRPQEIEPSCSSLDSSPTTSGNSLCLPETAACSSSGEQRQLPPSLWPPPSTSSSLSSSRNDSVASSSDCPTFICACCGVTKAFQKNRRYVWRATVAVATCVHKGFAKSLELPFPLDACKPCYDIAKEATDLFRWSFPSESSFVSEDHRSGKRPAKTSHEAQVRLFSHPPVLFPAPSAFL